MSLIYNILYRFWRYHAMFDVECDITAALITKVIGHLIHNILNFTEKHNSSIFRVESKLSLQYAYAVSLMY
jgi:hypothetical protein